MDRTPENQIITLLQYLDMFGATLTKTEAKIIKTRFKKLGFKEIKTSYGIITF